VRFWDASAIVPLIVEERASLECRQLLDATPVVWALTPVEVISALERLARTGALDEDARRAAHLQLTTLRGGWAEVDDLQTVRVRAERLLAGHRLRAAGAPQLAAALVACDEQPAGVGFVCLDRDLTMAAEREGFDVLP
jgi:predicted nucleic acid-binding protein